jgi:hypothetical protein
MTVWAKLSKLVNVIPTTEMLLGGAMVAEALRNPYNKKMPYSEGNPTNGFKDRLTQYGQDGDVYHHILFVAGTVLSGDGWIRARFMDQVNENGCQACEIAILSR